MKNFITLSFLFIFLSSSAQELRYHLLDNNLNEVSLRKPNKISKEEQSKIYNYVEYYINEDGKVDYISYYYANGKFPIVTEGEFETKVRTYSRVSFSKPEDRAGALRSRGSVIPVRPPQGRFMNNDFKIQSFKKYWPNGQLMHTSEIDENLVAEDGLTKTYYSNGKVRTKEYRVNGELEGTFTKYWKGFTYFSEYNKGIRESLYVLNEDGVKWVYELDEEGVVVGDPKMFSSNGTELFSGTKNESNIKKFIDNKEYRGLLEGIYTVKHPDGKRSYKLGVLLNEKNNYIGYQLSGFIQNAAAWEAGEIRCRFEQTAVDGFFNLTWYDDYKKQEVSEIVEAKADGALLTFANYSMIRLYPKINSNSSNNTKISPSSYEWKGNGSGIILTKDGYIATNNHVIEDAIDIEVEFKNEGEIKSYKAKVIRTDPINDLAIIKINDESFNNLKSILYNFKTRRSEIGESVFALGYPKAFSMMGTDIKFTDGKISSLTGAMGDVTNYQTSTPIQPGNSGGPLFDMNGNLIAINASKIVKEDIENVSYSIKTIYLLTLIDALPKAIQLPYSRYLDGKPLTEQIKILQRYVTLIKVR